LNCHDSELLAVFNTAVAERLIAEGTLWQGRQVIRDLMARLGMSPEEIAETLQVPPATPADWGPARKATPHEKWEFQGASRTLSKLLTGLGSIGRQRKDNLIPAIAGRHSAEATQGPD
jgi:hypothetical protein